MMLLCCLLVFSTTEYTFAQSIRPLQNDIHITEKQPVMLSCKYEGSANSLHWYRQYPGSKPEFVLLVMEASTKHVTYADPRIPGMDGKMSMKDKQVDLEISSAEVSDSALYYCTLQPTVTGNTSTLHKNLYKVKKKNRISILLS
uniref:Ig-like domain-containing protein n=1 Tax=Sinocyclocheilus rhinocerous TaxID=307959 RepID=A0A673L900_9TELE